MHIEAHNRLKKGQITTNMKTLFVLNSICLIVQCLKHLKGAFCRVEVRLSFSASFFLLSGMNSLDSLFSAFYIKCIFNCKKDLLQCIMHGC